MRFLSGLLVAALILSAASITHEVEAATKKKITVGMLPKKKGLPYFSSCAKGGQEAAKDLGSDNAEGEVAIVTATLTAANQNIWIKYMKERLEKYPKIKLVAIKPSNEDQKLAFQVAQDLMNAYPNLKGLFGISSVAFP